MNVTSQQERDALIDRYLAGKMSDEEQSSFEIRLMDDAELLERVQITDALSKAFKNGTRYADSCNTHSLTDEIDLGPLRGKSVSAHFKSWLHQPFSLAASFLIAAMGLNTLYSALSSSESSLDQPLAIRTVLVLETARGELTRHFEGTPPYLLQIDVGAGNETSLFDLTLIDDGTKKEVFIQRGLSPDADGWLRVATTKPLNGNYQTIVQWTDNGGVQQKREYAVRVTRTTGP